jgi:excinuclease ABC subunit C
MADYLLEKEAAGIFGEAPEGCGVYLIRDSESRALYVGKSKSIRKRLFDHLKNALSGDYREEVILREMEDVEYYLTGNDLEALILENNLIKGLRPRYNIFLRDDKTYPYIRLDAREEFPRLTVVRRPRKDGALYFGPYTPARAMRQTIRVLGRLFPLRQCRGKEYRNRARPCLNFEVGRCPGPCSQRITPDEYRELVREVILFLKGKHDKLTATMEKRMKKAAAGMRYEEAAALRDRLEEMNRFTERQAIRQTLFPSADVIGLAYRPSEWVVFVLFIRHGNVTGGKPSYLDRGSTNEESEILRIFIERFYSSREDIPARVILPVNVEEKTLLESYLTARRKKKVKIIIPSRGQGVELLLLARKNALGAGERKRAKRPGAEIPWPDYEFEPGGEAPERIEVYDASSIHGHEAVACLVVWEEGFFRKGEYRRFRMRSHPGMDDYAMVREALRRRLGRVKKGEVPLPDMILVDGGAGHVSSMIGVLKDYGLAGVRVIGLSKGRSRSEGDRLHLEDGTVPELSSDDPMMRFLGRLRDEAHRFTVGYHRKRRRAGLKRSVLDEIRGVGPRRKAVLLNFFGDLESLARAGLEDLKAVPGIPADTAEAVYQKFRS